MLYDVTCGNLSDRVEASNPDDAWAAFCDRQPRDSEVKKHPKLHERTITKVTTMPEDSSPEVASSSLGELPQE